MLTILIRKKLTSWSELEDKGKCLKPHTGPRPSTNTWFLKMKRSTEGSDRSICHGIKQAIDRVEEQPALGHNVVQGRLHDIHELSHQLLQDLESGVYGTTRTLKVKPEPPYKPNPHLPTHTLSPVEKLLSAIQECIGVSQGIAQSASSVVVHMSQDGGTLIELRSKGDVYISRQRKHGGTFYSV